MTVFQSNNSSTDSIDEALEIPIWFSPVQYKVYSELRRYNVLVTGRRWGKSHFSLNLALIYAINNPRGEIWYICPTYRQSKLVAWKYISWMCTQTALRHFVQCINYSELQITLKNNASISLKGADNPDSLRGAGLIFAILDEYGIMSPSTWDEVIRPMLSDKIGSVLFIGTPCGFNHFYDMYENAQNREHLSRTQTQLRALKNDYLQKKSTFERYNSIKAGKKRPRTKTSDICHQNQDPIDPILEKELQDPSDVYQQEEKGWKSWMFTSREGGWIPEEEIEDAMNSLDPRIFRQEYTASWEEMTGRIYYNFLRSENVSQHIESPFPGEELVIGMDFNVNPMSSVVARVVSNQLHVIDAIQIPNSNTYEMAIEIKKKYGWSPSTLSKVESRDLPLTTHPDTNPLVCYPDPTGRARKTSSPTGTTDHIILQEHGFVVKAPRIAPIRIDRYNSVNAMLQNAKNIRNLLIHPRARHLTKSLEGLVYKPDSNEPDTSSNLDHITDALGYVICSLFPLRSNRQTTTKMKYR